MGFELSDAAQHRGRRFAIVKQQSVREATNLSVEFRDALPRAAELRSQRRSARVTFQQARQIYLI
ncbi:hypothetical protein [Burkholderia ambifaria]|uniref:hypothetical protein n=1 Tax=Burkholderia ambifaria TaxID=152480 RepID=UPI001F49365A|nr:hypothetical protein [Burkholderia ambifaria]